MTAKRRNSFAFCGGAYGDEGKGRIVDMFVNDAAQKGPVVVYRDNGGANAGHTIEFADGQRVAFHQLPSGVFAENTTVILGKGMVIHPGDLLAEIDHIKAVSGGKLQARIMIDEMAVLSLDTHRAYESALKQWQDGSKGSTGRGISPAYADILLRHPLRMRDLRKLDQTTFQKHYSLYEALVAGLGMSLATIPVPTVTGEMVPVGSASVFIQRLRDQASVLQEYLYPVTEFLMETWPNEQYTYIFEKAQAIGLHPQWGVYPDVTASDTTFYGIYTATEGIINPEDIEVRAAVLKATYMSSVGSRLLPTVMPEGLAQRIREDAWEYGATTKRPRGIAYVDLPSLSFFSRVGGVTHLILTHMDVAYPDVPIKVCVDYEIDGKIVSYRPDQQYLNQVTPKYLELPSWDVPALQQARSPEQMPKEAVNFLQFMQGELDIPILMITTGPKREQGLLLTKDY